MAAPEAPFAAHEAALVMPPPVDDRFTAANAELDALLAAQKASRNRESARGRGLALPGGFTLSPTAVRMLLPGIFLLIGIAAWVIMGGVARANEGKVARIPVPAGSELVGTEREYTVGLVGELSEEMKDRLATRVFTMPITMEAATEYYGDNGIGGKALAEDGWKQASLLTDGYFIFGHWKRQVSVGFRQYEVQELDIRVDSDSGDYSTARITCLSVAVEELEFPVK